MAAQELHAAPSHPSVPFFSGRQHFNFQLCPTYSPAIPSVRFPSHLSRCCSSQDGDGYPVAHHSTKINPFEPPTPRPAPPAGRPTPRTPPSEPKTPLPGRAGRQRAGRAARSRGRRRGAPGEVAPSPGSAPSPAAPPQPGRTPRPPPAPRAPGGL